MRLSCNDFHAACLLVAPIRSRLTTLRLRVVLVGMQGETMPEREFNAGEPARVLHHLDELRHLAARRRSRFMAQGR